MKKVLEFAEVWKGIEAMMAKVPEGCGKPISIAVVDARGDVVALLRMDGAHDFHTQMALKKAWTSARWRRDTTKVWERLNTAPAYDKVSVQDFGTDFCTMAGGVAIVEPGKAEVLGAIGISGRPDVEDDEAIAMAGLKAIQESISS